ncbi:uncharacterized protein LOC125496361 [Beta vulgaris subsp. vulgaris]|uniref:uncharacterized protein LOC125496361 n=1 Tax=Beta vulgaris subsp. vulgaris TaxID=3555 RepID=UPI0020369626|nr:uncharacterized protein LOC125496361 [Beta vulgaris subsp. vulgaris]
MEQGASMKLSFLIVILMAFASFLSPSVAEARQNNNNHGYGSNKAHRGSVKSSDPLPSPPLTPTTVPTPSQNDGVAPSLPTSVPPQSLVDHITLSPTPLPIDDEDDVETPPPLYNPYGGGAPVNSPPWYETAPPYVPHGCGYGPCVDSNDCDWPCTVCCWNQTCCYDLM